MLKVQVPKGTTVTFCGDVHEHEDQFLKLIEEIDPNEKRLFASVGDIFDKGHGTEAAERILDKIKELSDDKIGFMIKGNHELKRLRHYKRHKLELSPQLEWVKKQPTAILFEFHNRSRVLMVHGGVTPNYSWDDIHNNIETCYVRWVDDKGNHIPLKNKITDGKIDFFPAKTGPIWHEKYDGRFGYIVSGHFVQKDGEAKFYNYSCNLDSGCYFTGKLTAQEFTDTGTKGKKIVITGPSKWSDANQVHEQTDRKGIYK